MRVGGIQVACCALGAVLAGYGVFDMVRPRAETYVAPVPLRYRTQVPRGAVHLSRRSVQLSGVISVVFGVGIAAAGFTVPAGRRSRRDASRPRQ